MRVFLRKAEDWIGHVLAAFVSPFVPYANTILKIGLAVGVLIAVAKL